ncbi:Crp/Fnr family transcriptional regulator [Brevibacillus sp. SYSU BS000544]|uniref:Crp/Fnr family transcriptional regulator n=1 Tax=Brevibacillus sp. SYSU BS000544 TaxID=3416443 RepID=UPI003CE4E488
MPITSGTFTDQISISYIQELQALGSKRVFHESTVLFMDGEKADFVYFIHEGTIQITKTTANGKELTIASFGAGELAGVFGLFDPTVVYSATGMTISTCEVTVIQRTNLEKLLTQNGAFCIEFMRWMATANRRMQSKFRDLLLNGKTGALYSTLIRMCNSYGKEDEKGILIELPLTNRELAQYIGLTRETVNRMLAELKKLDVIELRPNGYILVKDVQYLKDTIFCDDCPPDICRI